MRISTESYLSRSYVVVVLQLVVEVLPHVRRVVDPVEARLAPVELDPLSRTPRIRERDCENTAKIQSFPGKSSTAHLQYSVSRAESAAGRSTAGPYIEQNWWVNCKNILHPCTKIHETKSSFWHPYMYVPKPEKHKCPKQVVSPGRLALRLAANNKMQKDLHNLKPLHNS